MISLISGLEVGMEGDASSRNVFFSESSNASGYYNQTIIVVNAIIERS